ncbi:hypothetical protein VPNG_10189 [Cytospora leucostoma]|uniref:O-methyltransferase domain-containing protein n=1 Tax=Cytospora leucostoma TaxID=1230097 RepID=A0A423VFE4_9PEZI|nr:hypothetical protein VPNG_10189 [Cytospora leucostoma]
MVLEDPPVDVAIAINPTDLESVPRLVKDINEGVKSLTTGGHQARHELVIKARSLMLALETPRETMIKHCWAQTGAMAGINLGIDTGLWKLMAKNGDKPQKVVELSRDLGIDPALLSRLLRHLSAMGYIIETDTDEYMPTNFSKALSIPIISGGYPAMLSVSRGAIMFHEYARAIGWKNPTDAKNTSMMFAYKTDKDMFAYQQALGYGPQFNLHMGGYRQGRPPWMTKIFPVQERLINGADADPEAPFLVDIGGSVGHDLVQFQQYFPNHPGKLILEDLSVVLSQIPDPERLRSIEKLPHDFTKPQPVKGKHIKDAMKPGYSKLLINENVLPQRNAHWESSALDMVMLTLFNSKERTHADWYYLLEKLAGLRIVRIWDGGKGVESIIECEV